METNESPSGTLARSWGQEEDEGKATFAAAGIQNLEQVLNANQLELLFARRVRLHVSYNFFIFLIANF